MQTYKITFDFELEVDSEEENINDSVLNWIMQNGLYPLYKVQTIGSVNSWWKKILHKINFKMVWHIFFTILN